MIKEEVVSYSSYSGVDTLKKLILKVAAELKGSVATMDMVRFVEENEIYPPEYGIEISGNTYPLEFYPSGTMWWIQVVVDDTGVRRNVFVNALGTEKVPIEASIFRRDLFIEYLKILDRYKGGKK